MSKEKKSNWLCLRDVTDIAMKEPEKQSWCVHSETFKDFIMTAKDIKDTIGNFDWAGWEFMPLSKPTNEKSLIDKEPSPKFKVLNIFNYKKLEDELNNFSKEHPDSIIDVKFNTTYIHQNNLKYSILYSVLITYND